jgi:hypothetical protein
MSFTRVTFFVRSVLATPSLAAAQSGNSAIAGLVKDE